MDNDQFNDAVRSTLYALNMLDAKPYEQIGILIVSLTELLLAYASNDPKSGKIIASNVSRMTLQTEKLIRDNL